MKMGTHVKLPDGRMGTVVYNGLDGIGIKWGRHELMKEDEDMIAEGNGNCFRHEPPENYPWFPDAMLREPYPGTGLPCVGEEYEVLAAWISQDTMPRTKELN